MAILEAILLCDPFNIIPGCTPIRSKCVKSFWLNLICTGLLKKCIFRSIFLFYESFPEKFCTINSHGKLNGQSEVIFKYLKKLWCLLRIFFLIEFVYLKQGCTGCIISCFKFRLEEENLQIARQKALINYKILEQKMYGNSSNNQALENEIEIERRADIVRHLRKQWKQRLSV